jgi:hypothetical protein
MLECNCGKEFKTENGLSKHVSECPYAELVVEKIYNLGHMINEVDKKLFHVALGKIKKYAKDNQISFEQSQKILQEEAIYKYRKSLWDILMVWKDELLASEFRPFLKWVWKTYKEITLLSLRNTLSNTKIIYRFNLENTTFMIGKRIDDSLIHIHEHGDFSNDFEFVDAIISGQVSMYYVLFNDWLAQKWFGRLDIDLQHELEEYVQIASKTVLDRLKKEEFELLQTLACTETPKIFTMT